MTQESRMGRTVLPAEVEGDILVCDEGLSFWGGVNAETGLIQDALHPQVGQGLAGRILMMPTSRGSCTGSGVLLGLALAGRGPKALIFREDEDILTLGALIAGRMFGQNIAVLRLDAAGYAALAGQHHARIGPDMIEAGPLRLPLARPGQVPLALTATDRRMLDGAEGEAVQLAMEIVQAMAAIQGARELVDVTRVHIDGCIYAGPAFLTFAERMAGMGAQVKVPTTMNAISVDHANWRLQGVDPSFGEPASRLANAYLRMGARPSFTCAPYLLPDRPGRDEVIAWAESNAVIYANSVLGARTVKHPDFLDLCIALTGRAPRSGVYFDAGRTARRIVEVEAPAGADDAFWPMLGWLLGEAAPDRIPLLRGLEGTTPGGDDLKALCAAFGTTSAAPMLHVAGITPEAASPPAPDADRRRILRADFARAWRQFNAGPAEVGLVALGSPHFSAPECRAFLAALAGRHCAAAVRTIITLGRDTLAEIRADGTESALRDAGVTIVADLCWCSISEPVFPPEARVLMTNSGKYAHYGPGLSGRAVRFGSLRDCAEAAVQGRAPDGPPDWCRG